MKSVGSKCPLSGLPVADLQAGFTLVELVVTIFLLGILSAFIMPRFLSSESYNAINTRDHLLSAARAAQQRAMGRDDVSLRLELSGQQWQMIVSDGSGELQRSRARGRGVQVSSDVNISNSCQSVPGTEVVSTAAPLEIEYGRLGQLQRSRVGSGAWQDNPAVLRICVNNSEVFSLCISGAGFAYTGDCAP